MSEHIKAALREMLSYPETLLVPDTVFDNQRKGLTGIPVMHNANGDVWPQPSEKLVAQSNILIRLWNAALETAATVCEENGVPSIYDQSSRCADDIRAIQIPEGETA